MGNDINHDAIELNTGVSAWVYIQWGGCVVIYRLFIHRHVAPRAQNSKKVKVSGPVSR